MTPADAAALRRAIELSRVAGARGDEPYGAVLADEAGGLLAEALNTQHTARDCTGHAELNLVREASRRLDRAALERCTAYASGEPCPMCAGALFWAGVRRVVFALDVASMHRIAGQSAEELLISCREIFERGTRRMEVIGPALAEVASAVLEAHYGRSMRQGLNTASREDFVRQLGGVFEHSPWVAERAWQHRPFSSVDALHQAMMQAVTEASAAERLALVRAHPELAGAEAKEGTLTADSSSEQARLGFTRLTRDEFETMARINRSYRDKHSFPCIVALRLHATRESVVREMERRIANDSETELREALEQIGHITRGRLEKILGA